MKNLIFVDANNQAEIFFDESAVWRERLLPSKGTRSLRRAAERAAKRAAGKERAKKGGQR